MNTQTTNQLLACRRCRRLHNQLSRLRISHPDYWNKPVPPCGDVDARLLIVGLAPGMHGANKSGMPFIGDASGDLLHRVLTRLNGQDSVRITNAVKCLPVKNLPSGKEIKNCARFLQSELAQHIQQPSSVILALGGVAHRAVVAALSLRQADFPFAHGTVHPLAGATLVDSYHCSRYNTQTGRLTESMFMDVVETALKLAHS